MTIKRTSDGSSVVSGPDGVNVGSAVKEPLVRSRVQGDAYDRLQVLVDGTFVWGDGTASPASTFTPLGTMIDVGPPTGGDDTALVQAAIAAAGSSGVLVFRRGTYLINNLTQTVSARWDGRGRKATTFRKNGNGPMLTVTGSAVDIDNCSFDGQGGTFTGEGIVVDTGGDDFHFGPNAQVTDTDLHTIKFASNAAGLRSHIAGTHYRHDVAQPAILFPPNESNGDRHLENIDCAGGVLADFAGCSMTHVVGCNFANVVFGANSKKVIIIGSRIASGGAATTILGRDHLIDVIHAASIILDATSQDCTITGEVNTGVTDNGTRNVVLVSQGSAGQPLASMAGKALMASDLPHTIDPRFLSGNSTFNANQAVYLRARGRAKISKIGLHVNVSSGNLCTGVYASNGSAGTLARPAARKGTSGSVPCPAAGYAEISLTGTVQQEDGDWMAVVVDNTTASLWRSVSAGFSSTLGNGLTHHQNSAFPLPDPAVPTTGALFSFILVGVV